MSKKKTSEFFVPDLKIKILKNLFQNGRNVLFGKYKQNINLIRILYKTAGIISGKFYGTFLGEGSIEFVVLKVS